MAETEPEMMNAYLPADFNEDDFVEYNPYPYKGGYDISLTYGEPLSPSPSICYPLHDGSTPTATTTTQNDPPSKPTAVPVPVPVPVSATSQPPPVSKPSFPNWYGRDFPDNWSSSRNYFGRCGHGHNTWGLTQWIADFLFGYLPVYGEKRDETHNYGNLNYAYERHNREVPYTVNVEPEASGWVSTHEEFGNDYHKQRYDDRYLYEGFAPLINNVNAYERHSCEKPISVEVDLLQHQQLSYHDSWKGGDYPLIDHVNTYARESHEEKPAFPVSFYSEYHNYPSVEYGNAAYSGNYNDHVEEDTNWPWGSSNYLEICHQQVYPMAGRMNSCELQRYEEPISIRIEQCQSEENSSQEVYAGTCDYPLLEYVSSYERTSHDETITVRVEQPLSREFKYCDVYQEGIFSPPEYVNYHEKQDYDEHTSVKVEPTDHVWSNDVNYEESYWEEQKDHTEPVYSYDDYSYSSSHIDPFEPSWLQDSRYQDIYQGNFSEQLKYDENPKEHNAWINWPFQVNSGYD